MYSLGSIYSIEVIYCCASCSGFWSRIPAHHQALGSSSSAFFLSASLLFLISICMSSCTVSSPSSFSIFLNQSVFSLCVTAWSYISSQKRLLFSAFGILLSLCIPSNSLNNLFWFDSNNRFCLYCFVLLPYLSSFAPTATNLCRTSSSTIPAPFLFTFNLWYVFCCYLFSCPCSTKTSCVHCSSN